MSYRHGYKFERKSLYFIEHTLLTLSSKGLKGIRFEKYYETLRYSNQDYVFFSERLPF